MISLSIWRKKYLKPSLPQTIAWRGIKMRQETKSPLNTGDRTTIPPVVMLQTTWPLVNTVETPLGSTESDAEVVVGEEDEPADEMGEEVVGGELADVAMKIDSPKEGLNAEALVVVTESPTTLPVMMQEGEKDPVLDLNNVTGKEEQDISAPTQVLEMTESPITEIPTTEAPVEPQTTEPATVEITTTPSLRTQEPEIISDAVTNDAANTQAPGYLSQGTNPLVLVVLGGICCIFLFVWGRKRRSSLISSPSKPGSAGSKGPKVQYTPVPDEQPFSHSQDDDDEYCDDYEEDSFANDRDNWDDWEGNSTQNQASQLNPFVAPPAAPRPTTPRQSPSSPKSFNLTKPLAPPPQHQEIAIEGKGDLLPSRSVESNSSSDSFEVVTDETHAPHVVTADTEKEESVDDLFSQFGMVPTFKKSAVVLPPPAAKSAAPGSQSATASSASSLPTAAEASALFAAELDDDLTAVDAADEWGEDDEWVKGI
ncbi:hypothetical protein P3T76_015339 [Phytophthora citrophthora]|uniref:Uncharacterized protein n=1 Tax=Phytophthora citrophthora TaxID=4793 RepID=A0AAD9LAF3_9STRA|nr:hypothetical protein P3T76_015339 [Phytophthora citrophthora]